MAGEQGFLQAAQAVAANSLPGETFLGSKDLSFYAGRNFVQWSGRLMSDPSYLQARLSAEQIRLAATNQGQLATASREVSAWVAEHAALIVEFGDNRVYRLQ